MSPTEKHEMSMCEMCLEEFDTAELETCEACFGKTCMTCLNERDLCAECAYLFDIAPGDYPKIESLADLSDFDPKKTKVPAFKHTPLPKRRPLEVNGKQVAWAPDYPDDDPRQQVLKTWLKFWSPQRNQVPLGRMAREFIAAATTEHEVVAQVVDDFVRVYTDALKLKLGVTCTCKTEDRHTHDDKCPVGEDPHWKDRTLDWSMFAELLIEPNYAPMRPCSCKPQTTDRCKKCDARKPTGFFPLWRPAEWASSATFAPKCRHYRQEVLLPDGTKIYCSSHYSSFSQGDALKGKPKVRYGLYLASSWNPDHIHTMIPWSDYGLPRADDEHVTEEILRHFALAKAGHVVEIGCQGGHGRTGTLLGAFACLAGVEPTKAVAWVHEHYCEEAIESPEQEWWVHAFGNVQLGRKRPPKPKPKPKPKAPTTKNQSSLFPTKEEAKKTGDMKALPAPSGPESGATATEDPFVQMRAAIAEGRVFGGHHG